MKLTYPNGTVMLHALGADIRGNTSGGKRPVEVTFTLQELKRITGRQDYLNALITALVDKEAYVTKEVAVAAIDRLFDTTE